MTDVTGALERLQALSMHVSYTGPGSGKEVLRLEVLMAKSNRFRVRVASDQQEIAGILSDGTDVFEWDLVSHRWTKYAASERPEGAPTAPRLLQDQSDGKAITFPISRYAASWVSPPSPYEWFLQRVRLADTLERTMETDAGREQDVLVGRRSMRNGPITLLYEVRCTFDQKTHFPAVEEITAHAQGQPASADSAYRFVYKDVIANPPLEPAAFTYTPGPGLSFVDPQSLLPKAPPLVGKSVENWTVQAIHGAPLVIGDEIGKQPLVLAMWATWCLPCREELRLLADLRREDEFKQVKVIAVSVDTDERRLKGYLEATPLPFRVARDPGLLDKLGASGVPTTVIVNSEGEVTALWTGWGSEDADKLRRALRACAKK
jgi:thiol-disulfide isomerase/thioredoxin